uniref:Uncharacterized protein n=1 Tax=Mycolicibacterium phage Alyssa1 TaxID=3240801 RepID=A0AB39U1P4_9CAUD
MRPTLNTSPASPRHARGLCRLAGRDQSNRSPSRVSLVTWRPGIRRLQAYTYVGVRESRPKSCELHPYTSERRKRLACLRHGSAWRRRRRRPRLTAWLAAAQRSVLTSSPDR